MLWGQRDVVIIYEELIRQIYPVVQNIHILHLFINSTSIDKSLLPLYPCRQYFD